MNRSGFAIAIAVGMAACGGSSVTSETSVAEVLGVPEGFPLPIIADDNPPTEAKIALGRHLFYDVRLSENQTQSCSSCHTQERAFADDVAVSLGSTGEALARNSPTLTNVAYNATQTWANPLLRTLEEQHRVPIFNETPIELGAAGHDDEILARFADDARYQDLFDAAFPEDPTVTFDHIVKALASFSRTLISGDSAFDRYVYGGDKNAMSASALRGLGCSSPTNVLFNATIVMEALTFQSRPFTKVQN
ncbi:MAG: cytochrome c peroxidase [Polyangiales bacterium]